MSLALLRPRLCLRLLFVLTFLSSRFAIILQSASSSCNVYMWDTYLVHVILIPRN